MVFSLVEEVEREQGERALLRALEVCRLHSQVWAVSKRVRVSLLVYLEAREQLKVVERTTWYQELKHCATAKFSTTRKLRKMKAEDRELARYAI